MRGHASGGVFASTAMALMFGLAIVGGAGAEQPDPQSSSVPRVTPAAQGRAPVTSPAAAGSSTAGMGTDEPSRPASSILRAGTDSAGDGPAAAAPVPQNAQAVPGAPAVTAQNPAPASVANTPVAPVPVETSQTTKPAAPVTTDSVGSGTESAAPASTQAAAPAEAAPAPSAPVQAATPAQPADQAATGGPAEAMPLDIGPLAPIAQDIAAILKGPGRETVATTKSEQEGLAAFYAERSYAPLFVDEHGIAARGQGVMARIEAAAEDGLDPADYAVAKPDEPAGSQALAKEELRIAAAALLYARHAQAGRFDPARISALVTPTRVLPDPKAVLEDLAMTGDVNGALASYNPPHAGYKALKARLADSIGKTSPAIAAIPDGPNLKPGGSDPRVPALRARLGIADTSAGETYDPQLAAAVKAFQEASGLSPQGVIGKTTVAALNRGSGGGGSRSADIIANMERWRWLPRELGANHVMVNIPEYLVRIYSDGREIHETRIVVGKPDTATPLLSHEMEYIVVNPAWNIPPSIATKEMLPRLQKDPYYLQRQGIEIVRRGKVVDPGSVSWGKGLQGYYFRQPPGERNALGRIKFMFPNQHAVYLHDTPSRSLFSNAQRAYSHGCVRVNDPLKFGEVVFNLGLPGQNWTEQRIGKLLGGKERYIYLKERLPVHLVYFTTVVENGRVKVLDDVYGFNAATKALLGLEGKRRVADRSTNAKR